MYHSIFRVVFKHPDFSFCFYSFKTPRSAAWWSLPRSSVSCSHLPRSTCLWVSGSCFRLPWNRTVNGANFTALPFILMYMTHPLKTTLTEKTHVSGRGLLQHISVSEFISPCDVKDMLGPAEMEAIQAVFLPGLC